MAEPNDERPAAHDRRQRKTRTGVVTSDKMDEDRDGVAGAALRAPGLRQAGDPDQEGQGARRDDGAKAGDMVRIMETRPLAKTVKRWRVVEIDRAAE